MFTVYLRSINISTYQKKIIIFLTNYQSGRVYIEREGVD